MTETNIETSKTPAPEMESAPSIKLGDITVIKGHNFDQVSLLLPPTGADAAAGAIAIVHDVNPISGKESIRYGRMGTIDEKTALEIVDHVAYEDAIRIIAHSLDGLYDNEEPKPWALEWAMREYPKPEADE